MDEAAMDEAAMDDPATRAATNIRCADRMTYHFVVPGPPIPKGRPRFGKGRTYTPKRTEDHERKIAVYALKAKVKCSAKPLSVECWFFLDNHRRIDADNLGKIIDGLNRVAWKDDDQIVDLLLHKRYDKENPRTEITITEAA